jgi:hypothetical protein
VQAAEFRVRQNPGLTEREGPEGARIGALLDCRDPLNT